MSETPFYQKETVLRSHFKAQCSEDIGRTFIESALKKCQPSDRGQGGSTRKNRSTEGGISLEAGPNGEKDLDSNVQKGIEYISQSMEAVAIDLSPAEVASAITTRLSDSAVSTLGAFVNQVYTYIGFEGNQAEKKAKKTDTGAYQSLVKLASSVFNIFNSEWVERGVSTTWSFVTNSLSRIFRGAEGALALIDRAFNISSLVRVAFRKIFSLLHGIASIISSGISLICDQAVGFIQHAYQVGKHILDRVTDGENGLKSIFEAGRIITDRLGMAAIILKIRSSTETEELSTVDTAVDTIPVSMGDCFNQILKLFPTIVSICDGYSADSIDASPEEKIEKESVVRKFVEWLTFNPLFQSVMSYAKSAATSVEIGWRSIATRLIGAIQKITSILSKSLYLALFAFKAFIGNDTVVAFLSHMGLTSSNLSAGVSNRRALTALGVQYSEDSMNTEEESANQVLRTVSDIDTTSSGQDMLDLVVSTHNSFSYPSIVEIARDTVRVFRQEMTDETFTSISKMADRLEKTLDMQGFSLGYARLFKTSSSQSRRAMRKLLDAISYVHVNTDAEFRTSLTELELKENRDAKTALRELKAIVMAKQEEIQNAALDLLRSLTLFERVPQDAAKPKKKKKPSKYEDARTTFDFKLGNKDDGLYDDPTADKGRLELAFMKVKEFTATAILGIKGNFLMGIAAIVATFAASYILGPGTALQCARALGSPFSFIASHIAQTWVVPRIVGLSSPSLDDSSAELIQSKSIVKKSVVETLDSFTKSVESQCFKNVSYFGGFQSGIEVTKVDTSDTCIAQPAHYLTGRIEALREIARSLSNGAPFAGVQSASKDFLHEMGELDVSKVVNLTATAEAYKQAALAAIQTDNKGATTAVLEKFNEDSTRVNTKIQSYVKTLKDFYSDDAVSYSFYKDAAHHLRVNVTDEWIASESRAYYGVIGEEQPTDPSTGKKVSIGISRDTEDIPEELRVRQTLLKTPFEQASFIERVRRSTFYAHSAAAFTTIQQVCQLSTLMIMGYNSFMTLVSVLAIQLTYQWLIEPWIGKRLFSNYNSSEMSMSQAMRRADIIESLSFGGSQFVGKGIYEFIRFSKFAIGIFFASSWGILVNAMFYPITAKLTDVLIVRQFFNQALIAVSTRLLMSTASYVSGRFLKVDGWVENNRNRSKVKVQ